MKKTFFIIILFIISCTDSLRLEKEEIKIRNFLEAKNNETFDLNFDTIAAFKWDELLIAGPYMNIHDITGYDLNKIPNTIKSHDNYILFCFIEDQKGIKYMEFERYLLSDKIFESKVFGKIYPKSESKFIIHKQ